MNKIKMSTFSGNCQNIQKVLAFLEKTLPGRFLFFSRVGLSDRVIQFLTRKSWSVLFNCQSRLNSF